MRDGGIWASGGTTVAWTERTGTSTTRVEPPAYAWSLALVAAWAVWMPVLISNSGDSGFTDPAWIGAFGVVVIVSLPVIVVGAFRRNELAPAVSVLAATAGSVMGAWDIHYDAGYGSFELTGFVVVLALSLVVGWRRRAWRRAWAAWADTALGGSGPGEPA